MGDAADDLTMRWAATGEDTGQENTPLNQRTRQWPNWDTFTTDLEFAHSTYRDIVGCEAAEACCTTQQPEDGREVK